MDDVAPLLERLKRAGEHLDPALLERIRAAGADAIPGLVALATDQELHDSPESGAGAWAALHAVRLLGELRATEAVEPLLPLMEWDDDWLGEELPDTYGLIGAPALAPLRRLLFDRQKDVWSRARASTALAHVAEEHPELRTEVIATLVQRLEPAETQGPEDEELNAFVITDLLDLKATEAEAAIRAAFEQDRVDTMIVDLRYALRALGLEPEDEEEPPNRGMRLPLRCEACGVTRPHWVERIFLDLGTLERKDKGETTQYSEYIIPQHITCPKCGAVDQYEVGDQARATLAIESLVERVQVERPELRATGRRSVLVPLQFDLSDGTPMHPYEARDRYRQQLEVEPRRADLWVRLGNVHRALWDQAEATRCYETAVRLEPGNLEALASLAQFALDAGEQARARDLTKQIVRHAPASQLDPERRDFFLRFAREALAHLEGHQHGDLIRIGPRIRSAEPEAEDIEDGGAATLTALAGVPSAVTPPAPDAPASSTPLDDLLFGNWQPQTPVRRTTPKVGRNDPCWCGSGRKYKKCHGH